MNRILALNAKLLKRLVYIALEASVEMVEFFIALQAIAWGATIINPIMQNAPLRSLTAEFLQDAIGVNPWLFGALIFAFGCTHVIVILLGRPAPRRACAMVSVLIWSFITFSIVTLGIRYPASGLYSVTTIFSALCFLRIHR